MRLPTLVTFCAVACLLMPAASSFADDFEITGDVTLGGRFLEENRNSSKFTEYRDVNDGIFGDFRFDARKGSYYLSLIGENVGFAKNHAGNTDKYHVGLDDQYYLLKGGKYDTFKFSLFYNETPHNLTYDARTFYAGAGGNNLIFLNATAPTANSYFSVFDYKVNRRDYGGSLELSFNTPFYLSIDVSENDKHGIQPFGAATGSPGQGSVELPMPVNYKTRNMFLEAGYRTKNLIVAIDGTLSNFENNNDYLFWRSPASPFSIQASSIAPDGDYWRIGGKVHLRLPWDSTLTLKGSFAKMENNLNLLPAFINIPSAWASSGNFKGDYSYSNVSADFTTHPVAPLDIRLYYHYLNKDNRSSTITFINTTTGDTSTNDRLSYNKQNAGLDVGYRLPLKTKINVGYEYLRVNRTLEVRPDANFTNDNKVYMQVKNSYFDFMTAKVKYEHLERRSDFQYGREVPLPTSQFDPDYIFYFIRPFDAADKTQDSVKLGLEFTPLENLQFGVEYCYKLSDYDQTILGRTSDERHEVYVDAGYTWPGKFRISGYFDYEWTTTDSMHRNMSFAGTTSQSPYAPPTTRAYNWTSKLKNDNYAYGFGLEVPVLKDKLNLVASWGYEKADGNADFASQNNIVALYNIGNYDDYVKKAVNIKAVYRINKNLNLTAGYAYEKYRYNDAATQGYQFVVPAGTGVSYLTGAYADNNYEANVWFLAASYRF